MPYFSSKLFKLLRIINSQSVPGTATDNIANSRPTEVWWMLKEMSL